MFGAGAAILAARRAWRFEALESTSAAQATPVGSLKVAKGFQGGAALYGSQEQQGSWWPCARIPRGA